LCLELAAAAAATTAAGKWQREIILIRWTFACSSSERDEVYTKNESSS